MKNISYQRATYLLMTSIVVLVCSTFAFAQRGLSDSVEVDLANAREVKQIKRATEFSNNGQYQDAIDALQQVILSDTKRIHPVSSFRFINIRDYCQIQIAQFPDQGLVRYRKLVDPTASKLYQQAIKTRDKSLLKRITSKYLCSSYGDDALFALGDIALEEADFAKARFYWQQLLEEPPQKISGDLFQFTQIDKAIDPGLSSLIKQSYSLVSSDKKKKKSEQNYILTKKAYYGLLDQQRSQICRYFASAGMPLDRLAYPATKLSYSTIRARLVLTSILAGTRQRAELELLAFKNQYPNAVGKIAGQNIRLATYLQRMFSASKKWSANKSSSDWKTFGGNQSRNKIDSKNYSLAASAKISWRVKISEPLAVETVDDTRSRNIVSRTGESVDALLSYHPIVWNDIVFVHGVKKKCNVINAFKLQSGKRAWPSVLNEDFYTDADSRWQLSPNTVRLGVPRFTLSATEKLLVSRIGTPVTKRTKKPGIGESGSRIEILNLKDQGARYRSLSTGDKNWSFEGCPIVKGRYLYVGLRRNAIPPRSYVACYDLDRFVPEKDASGKNLPRATQPQLKWRTFIAAADTPAIGQSEECTHNLLSMHGDTLYYNTNLGAIAALSAEQGEIRWLVKYPRSKSSEPTKMVGHWNRDLNPCVYHQGVIIVAPSDSASILAIDANSGQVYWNTSQRSNQGREPEDAIHILGVTDRHVIVSGDRLYWIDFRTGRVKCRWPEGVSPSVRGYGRGTLVGRDILWPTKELLYVFAQDELKQDSGGYSYPKMRRQPVRLGILLGNLLFTGNRLLITTPTELIALEVLIAD